MRSLIVFVAASLFATLLCGAPPALTSVPPTLQQRERERLDLEHRLYERVDFVVQARRLESQITLTKARVQTFEKLLAEHQSTSRFDIGAPLTLTIEDTKLSLLEAKLTLADLQAEKSLLEKYRDEQRRLYELRK